MITVLALAACQPAARDDNSLHSPTSPDVTLQRSAGCQLQGGGVDGVGTVVTAVRNHRAAIRIEGIFTTCSEGDGGTWFRVWSFVDDGTASGRRILLASDHAPVVLRRVTTSSGTLTSWQVNVEFVPTSSPLILPNGFQPIVLVEAFGPGGKIGEVSCYLDESPAAGPRGPRSHQ